MSLEREDIARGLLLGGLGAFVDPTGMLLPAAVEAACKLIPDRSHEEELERLKKVIQRKLPKGLVAQEAYRTATGILEIHFRGTRDLYTFGESSAALADELLRRFDQSPGKTHASLTKTHRGFTRQYLLAFIGGCLAMLDEVSALERLFRIDVRARLEQLRRDAATDRVALDHLARWVRIDILHDPRDDFRRRRRRHHTRNPAGLLDARAERVPFFGREQELASFEAWLADETDFLAWIIAGPGGIGKTRLMLEALDHARVRGWRAGFLRSGLTSRDVEAAAEALRAGERPVLVVIDYAENRPDLVTALLDPWLDDGGTRRRLVLLCRRQDLLRDALDRRTHEGAAARDARDYLGSTEVHHLTEDALLLPLTRRRAAFTKAQAAFLRAGVGPDDTTPYAADQLTEAFFERKLFGRSLYLHAAAYTSLFGQPKVRRSDLLGFMLEREYDHLTRLCQGEGKQEVQELTGDDLRPVLALATLALAAPSSAEEAAGIPEAEAFLCGGGLADLSGHARRALGALLARIYPHPAGSARCMDALRPDPLGEALVFEAVTARPQLLDHAFGPPLDGAAFDSAATVLYRAAHAFSTEGEGERWLQDRLEEAGILERASVVDVFLRQIPLTTTGFARFTATLAEGRAMHTRAQLDAAPENEHAQRTHAMAVGTLGTRYANLGRREEALEATEQAVQSYRQLAERNPDAFLPDLARSLGALGSIHHAEDPAGAADVYKEGIRLLTPYFTQLPKAFAPLMASLVQAYARACEEGGHAVEEQLLAPLLPFFSSPDAES